MSQPVPYTGVLINTPVPRGHPPEGAKALWASIIWGNVAPSSAVQITIPLHLVSTISQITSVYVDNTQSFVPIIIQAIDTQQMITIPAGYQGVYSVYTSATNINIFQVIPDVFSVSNIYFLNYYEVPWQQPGKTFVNGLFSQTGATTAEFIITSSESGGGTLPGIAGHISAISVSGSLQVPAGTFFLFAIQDIGSTETIWAYRGVFDAAGSYTAENSISGINVNYGFVPFVGGPGLTFNASFSNPVTATLRVMLYQ